MSVIDENCQCNLKYKLLSAIDRNWFPQIKRIFIFTKYFAADVIFVTAVGDVYGYGTNKFGRLGLGHNFIVAKPTIITELCAKDVMKIEFGGEIMVALTKSMDSIYISGFNGESMEEFNPITYQKPFKVDLGGKLVTSIECVNKAAFFLCDTKGFFVLFPVTPLITEIEISENVCAISCGRDYVLALTDTGRVYSSGDNQYGQLGLGHKNKVLTLAVIQLPENIFIKQVSCGYHHSLLLSTEGRIYFFGNNDCGQLGTDDANEHLVPKLMESKTKFTQIYAFESTSMAVNENNKVVVLSQTQNRPLISTNFSSFQEAINAVSENPFTFKPITPKEIFVERNMNRVMKTMAKAFNNSSNSDLKFKLKYKGSENNFDFIYVHKWIVEETSEYFRRMFANNWSESRSNEIEIKGYSYEAYYQFIKCLYTDDIETQDLDLLFEIFSITDEYLDEAMKTKCVESIKFEMDIENVCSVYSSALKYRSKELEEYCFSFMVRYMTKIIETDDYKRMDGNSSKHFLTNYLKTCKMDF